MAIHLSSISATFFINLLSRLGVKPPPPDGFDLINTVQPVSLVDSDIVLSTLAVPSLTLQTPFTQGKLTNVAAATLMADTGAQSLGDYNCYVQIGCDNGATNGVTFEIVRRNAANNADVWLMMGTVGGGNSISPSYWLNFRIHLDTNERLIVRVGAQAIPAALTGQANIWIGT